MRVLLGEDDVLLPDGLTSPLGSSGHEVDAVDKANDLLLPFSPAFTKSRLWTYGCRPAMPTTVWGPSFGQGRRDGTHP
jgi:hypothetical protein